MGKIFETDEVKELQASVSAGLPIRTFKSPRIVRLLGARSEEVSDS